MTEIFITSSVLIAALLLMRKLFRNSLSRRVQYALWALVLIRLLVPVNLPAMNFSVLTAARPVEKTVTETIADQPIYIPVAQEPLEEHPLAWKSAPEYTLTKVGESVWVAQSEQQTAVEYKRLAPQTVLSWIWIAGSAILGAFLLTVNLRFWLWLRKARKPYEVDDCKLRVYLVEAGLPSPCLFGLFRPAIYLTPAAIETEESLRHVLAHELTHARHLDHLWTFLRGVCLAVYWFDPLVWAASAAAKKDCELACDEGALAKLDEEDRIPYGETLVSLIPVRQTVNPMLATTAMTTGKKHLKDRVSRIAAKPRQLVAAVVAVALLTVAISACTFTGGNADKPLRFCLDLTLTGTIFQDNGEAAAEHFLKICEEAGGPKDVELEILPREGEERETALRRLRTEIMSGKGPDVFLLDTCPTWGVKEALFPYPEQSMANELFLPLDDLMKTSQFTDWGEQISIVMDSGKLQGKQYLLPAAYTFPVTLCKKEDVTAGGTARTRGELLNSEDPLLRASALPVLVSSAQGLRIVDSNFFKDLFPRPADYSGSKLTFSEEDLLGEVQRNLELMHRYNQGDLDGAPAFLQTDFCVSFPQDTLTGITAQGNPLAFLPLLCEDGSISATVTTFAAINANTDRAEEAFFLLDMLFSRDYLTRNVPMTGATLCNWLYEGSGLPVDEKLMQEEYPVLNWWLSEENFQSYRSLRDRITDVKFCTPLDTAINDMFLDCLFDSEYDEDSAEGETQETVMETVAETYTKLKQMISES